MKRFLSFTAILLLFIPGCPESSVKQHSADLDRVFIPLMYFVETDQLDKAATALNSLQSAWDEGKEHLTSKDWQPEEWEVSPNYIDERIAELDIRIQAGDQFAAAWVISDIHCSMSEWRAHQGVDYYLDEWYEFKYDTDMLAHIANDQLLDLHDWNEVEWLHDYVTDAWYFLSTQQPDTQHFSVDETELNARILRINDTLHYLNEAMECAQRENVAAVSQQLRHDVLRAIMLFGDFGDATPL